MDSGGTDLQAALHVEGGGFTEVKSSKIFAADRKKGNKITSQLENETDSYGAAGETVAGTH